MPAYDEFLPIEILEGLPEELEYPDQSDLNIIFYIAGFITHSVTSKSECHSCKEILCQDLEVPIINDDDLDGNVGEFLMQVNRGGLSYPSDNCFTFCIMCWIYFL